MDDLRLNKYVAYVKLTVFGENAEDRNHTKVGRIDRYGVRKTTN